MTKRIFWGTVFVALGVLYLIQEIGSINLGLSFWPVVGVLFGGILIWSGLRRAGWMKLALGLWVGAIGLLNILHRAEVVTGVSGADVFAKGWPLILIAIGLSVMFGRSFMFRFGNNHKGKYVYHMVGDLRQGRGPWTLNKDLTMEHGVGDTKLDLTTADIAEGVHHIRVTQAMGEVVIRVPDNVNAIVDAQVNIGNLQVFDDNRNGMSLALEKEVQVPDSKVELRIEARLRIGNLKVIMEPAMQPRFVG